MGMLNAKDVFGVPAMASSFFNLGSIIGGVALWLLLDPHFGSRALIGLALGTFVGGLAAIARAGSLARARRFQIPARLQMARSRCAQHSRC